MLYYNMNKKHYGLFSDNYFITASISSERVLEQVQSLLITVPHISSFFCTFLIHPSYFMPNDLDENMITNNDKGNETNINQGNHNFMDVPYYGDKMIKNEKTDGEKKNNEIINYQKEKDVEEEKEYDDEAVILEYELKRKKTKDG